MRQVTETDHRERIERVVAQIRREPDRTLALSDIADIAALSPFHLIRVFRQITGYTPAAMQTAVRIQEAKRLLIGEQATVTDACFTVGFASLGSFSQRFTWLSGVNPSEYRTAHHRVDDLVEALLTLRRAPVGSRPEPRSVSGRITGEENRPAFFFVGLFPPGPPQGKPIRGDVLNAPGEFVIRNVPDGVYAIYAAAIAHPARSVDWVLPDSEWQTGGGEPVRMVCGLPVDSITIELRSRDSVVLPLTTTLMAIPGIADAARLNHRLAS